MYPAALQKISTKTVDSAEFFERWILQKQQNILNKKTKVRDKEIIRDLEQVWPKQIDNFFLDCCLQRQFLRD